MSQPVLIDTCVLKELVSTYEFSGYLKQIISWVETKYIHLIVPQTIQDEWKKHREEEQKKIDRVIKNYQSDLKKSNLFFQSPDFNEVQIEGANKLLLSQIASIDKLLDDGLNINDEPALNIMWNHFREGKAPFHKKKESHKDAVIIFSALNAIKESTGKKLIVFSSNHTDLADLTDKSKIHPEIAAAYPEIQIIYFADKSLGIKILINDGLPSLLASLPKAIDVKSYFPVNPNLTPLDQVHSYLERRFKDINFLPKSLFSHHAPIISANSTPSKILPFHINTDNEEIFNIFIKHKNLDIDASEVLKIEDFGEKFIKVCQHLRNNYVYGLVLNDNGNVEIPNFEMVVCNCERCSIRKFKFGSAFETLQKENPENTLKSAFNFYLLGDFESAIKILKIVAENSENEKNFISYYIANYNQFLLHRHLTLSIFNRNDELADNVKHINLEDVLIKSRAESLNEILDFLERGNFWKAVNIRVEQLVGKIRNEKLDNVTGWTESFTLLIECYFETVSFIEENYIMLDNFSEVFNLTSKFVEGIFASYSSNINLVSKLTELNDPILKKLIIYGKNDDFIKNRNRFNIQILPYIKSEKGESLTELFGNLIESYIYFTNRNQSKLGKEDYFLISKLRKMIFNSMILSSMIKLKNEDLNSIALKFFDFLVINEHKNNHEISKIVSYFLKNNGLLIEKDILAKYLNFFILSDRAYDYTYIILTIKALKISKSLYVKFSPLEWKQFKLKNFKEDLICKNTFYVDYLCSLYYFLHNSKQKLDLVEFVTKSLEDSFSSDLYYNLTLNRIIRNDRIFEQKYEEHIIERALQGKKASMFPEHFYHDFVIDEYINYCFCYNISFSSGLINSLEVLGDYYKWIVDVKTIQEVDMNIDWLFVYPSNFYYKNFKRKMGLKDWLKKEILNSKDVRAGKIYAQLF